MPTSPFRRRFTLSFITEWRKLGLPLRGGKVVLAVSGGADSCALACAVHEMTLRGKLSNEVTVAHFDHRLRGSDSARDVEFVRNLSDSLGFDFRTASAGKSLSRSKSNMEERARKARYSFLQKTAADVRASAVLTAHTLNDQAETLLLNLLRGSGVAGLAGMRPVRELGNENVKGCEAVEDTVAGLLLVRPFLTWAFREDTERFAAECGLTPRRDAMNDDLAFSRVRVRKELIPYLSEYNPNIVASLARTAESAAGALELLNLDPSELAAAGALSLGDRIKTSELLELSAAARNHVLRSWLGRVRGDLRGIEKSHLEAVAALAASGKSGKTAELPGSGSVVKSGGRLIFQKRKVEK